MKTNNKRNPAFLLTVSFFRLETTPLRCDALGDGTHHSRLPVWRDGTCFMKWVSPPLPGLFIPPQKGQTTSVGVNLKLEKKNPNDFWHFSSGNCGTSGSYVWVGGLAWIWIWGVKHAFCWHWGRGVFSWCHPPSVCYICRNHLWLMDTIVTWTA